MAKSRDLSIGAVMILHALARGARYGFDIMEETGLTSGTVYPTLDRLEENGLASSSWEDAEKAREEKRPPRRYFAISKAGERELIEAMDRYKALAPVTIRGTTYPTREKLA